MADDLTPAERSSSAAPSEGTTYWFDGVTYTASDRAPIVDYLLANRELVNQYVDRMIETQVGMFSWGDFQMAQEGFTVLCQVMADLAERQGRNVMR